MSAEILFQIRSFAQAVGLGLTYPFGVYSSPYNSVPADLFLNSPLRASVLSGTAPCLLGPPGSGDPRSPSLFPGTSGFQPTLLSPITFNYFLRWIFGAMKICTGASHLRSPSTPGPHFPRSPLSPYFPKSILCAQSPLLPTSSSAPSSLASALVVPLRPLSGHG